MNESREHLLISKVVDGDAADPEWNELAALAEQNSQLWRELAEAQRDHAALVQAMASAAAIADAVEVEASNSAMPRMAHIEPKPSIQLNRIGAWSGWAVAALVIIAALPRLAQFSPQNFNGGSQSHEAGLVPIASAADAFEAYLDKGRASGQVIGEVPTKVLVESRPSSSGTGFEIVFLRQVLERTTVPELYQIEGQNEFGQPTLVRYQQPRRGSM